MSRWILPFVLMFLLGLAGAAVAQPVPMQGNNRPPPAQAGQAGQASQAGEGSATLSSPATRELAVRAYIVEWIVTAGLTILAVFAVGRTSWRG